MGYEPPGGLSWGMSPLVACHGMSPLAAWHGPTASSITAALWSCVDALKLVSSLILRRASDGVVGAAVVDDLHSEVRFGIAFVAYTTT